MLIDQSEPGTSEGSEIIQFNVTHTVELILSQLCPPFQPQTIINSTDSTGGIVMRNREYCVCAVICNSYVL